MDKVSFDTDSSTGSAVSMTLSKGQPYKTAVRVYAGPSEYKPAHVPWRTLRAQKREKMRLGEIKDIADNICDFEALPYSEITALIGL